MTDAEVLGLFNRVRFSVVSECELQIAVAKVLGSHQVEFEREFRLSGRDRPDFLLSSGLVLELKTKGSGESVARQMSRYAEYPRVTSVALLTTRRSHMTWVPQKLKEKPAYVVLLRT